MTVFCFELSNSSVFGRLEADVMSVLTLSAELLTFNHSLPWVLT